MSKSIFSCCYSLLLHVFIICCAFSQQYMLDDVSSKNHLSENSIYAILRDREGFLWVGTQNGLNRYDGEQYVTFIHSSADSSSISDNFILSLAEDPSGDIWIGTRYGLNRFNKRTGRFSRFIFPDNRLNSFHQRISSLALTPDGKIYVAEESNVHYVDISNGYSIHSPSGMDSNCYVYCDRRGNLILGSGKGFQIRDSTGQSSNVHFDSRQYVTACYGERDRLWIGTSIGLWMYEYATGRIIRASRNEHFPDPIEVFAIAKDPLDRMWIGTNKGILIKEKNGLYHTLAAEPEHPGGLHFPFVQALVCDNAGLLWIGQLRSGLQRYDTEKEKFSLWIPRYWKGHPGVWSIVEDDQRSLWIGMQDKLLHIRNGELSKAATTPFMPRIFDKKLITALLQDGKKNIWIGTKPNGLFRYSPATKHLTHFTTHKGDSSTLVSNNITALFEARNGKIWIATSGGLCSFDPGSNIFQKITLIDIERSAEVTYILHIYEDRQRILWISTSSGLFSYDERTGKQRLYGSIPADSSSLSYNIVASTLEDRKGRLWAATLGGGFNLLHRETGNFTRYNVSKGLVNDVVYGILEDSLGRIWMSTDHGLACFDPEGSRFISIGKEEGLQTAEFCQNALFKNAAGRMFSGSVDGVVVFTPENIKRERRDVPIVVSDIRINYESISPDDAVITKGTMTSPEEIDLTYEQKTLSIDFASLNFRSPEKTTYSYRLQNFYDGWVTPVHHQRTAHYTHLPSGEYLFVVRSSTQKNEWDEQELRIRIVVHPPFWETWWFRLMASFSVLGIVVTGVRYTSQRKLKVLLREIELQHKLQSERERISRDLHDSTGSHLAGIIAGLNIAEKHLKRSKPKTLDTLQSLTEEARSSMNQLRETIITLKTDSMTVRQFVELAGENVSKLIQFRKGVRFTSQVEAEENIILSPIQTLNLIRILEEAVANALKHAETRSLILCVERKDRSLIITLQNDGRKKKSREDSQYTGNGTLNMERRAAELGGTYSRETDEKKGTVVTISIPLDK